MYRRLDVSGVGFIINGVMVITSLLVGVLATVCCLYKDGFQNVHFPRLCLLLKILQNTLENCDSHRTISHKSGKESKTMITEKGYSLVDKPYREMRILPRS